MGNRVGFQSEIPPLQAARNSRLAASPATDMAVSPSAVRYEFCWSHRRLRLAGMLVAIAAVSAAPLMLAASAGVRLACIAWLALLYVAANGLARRISSVEPVITVDVLGVTDRRRSDAPIFWQEIGTLRRCDVTRSQVIEFFLVHPQRYAGRSLWDRLGGRLQVAYGLPAVSLSLLLIDASAIDFISAVSAFRPGLVPRDMSAV